MARTAPVPNIPAIPGMNPGVFVMGGGGSGGGGSGKGGKGAGGAQGAGGDNAGDGAEGGGANAGSCGPGSGGGCPNPSHGGSGTAAGDPVDFVTGRVFTVAATDLSLPGPLPLIITRSYSSERAWDDEGLGYGWSHSLEWRIDELRRKVRIVPPHAAPTLAALPEMGTTVALPCGKLTRLRDAYTLDAGDGMLRVLVRDARSPRRFRLVRIVDANDNRIELERDAQGALVRAIDSVGRQVRVRRNGVGRIAAFEVHDASQGAWIGFRRYEYDSRGDLVAAIDAHGAAMTFEYDEDHRLVRKRFPGGLATHWRYDATGRCVETWCVREEGDDGLDEDVPDVLADGTPAKGFLHCRILYDDGLSEVVTSRGIRRYEAGAAGTVDKAVWAGGVHTKKHDAAGELLSYTNSLGATWELQRDELGRLVAAVDPLGAFQTWEYDERGAVLEATNALGQAVSYRYDERGNLLEVRDPTGVVVSYRYDERGLMTEATLPAGVTRCSYDELGNRVEVVEPDGTSRRIRYDFLGRPIGVSDSTGREWGYAYDAMGKLLSIRTPSGATETYRYDRDGNLTGIADGDGRMTTLERGGYHQVTRLVRPGGQVVEYRYDREQELVRIINESGDEHRLERDSEGRIRAEHTFDGRRLCYDHDGEGRIIKTRRGDETTTEYVYDPVGRLLQRVYDDGGADSLEYDLLGRLVETVKAGVRVRFEYDDAGNIVREHTVVGDETTTIERTYDSMGRVIATTLPTGTELVVERDVLGRSLGFTVDGDTLVRIAWDPGGFEANRRLPRGASVFHDYDANRDIEAVRVVQTTAADPEPGQPQWVGQAGGKATFAARFRWSPGGEMVGCDAVHRVDYQRDENGRVLARLVDGTPVESFGYLPSGEPQEAGAHVRAREYDRGGRLREKGGTRYVYDARGRVVEKIGAEGARWTLVWGADDLLKSVTTPAGERVEMYYDAFARRIAKNVVVDGRVVARTRYTWDADAVLREVRETFSPDGERVTESIEYAVLPGNPLPLAQRKNGGEWQHYVYAPNGVPLALLAGDGSVIDTYEPSLFGALGDVPSTSLRYAGQHDDRETGFFYNRHRYYDPDTGVYISPEPLGLMGSLKPYAFVDGYPLDAVDIDGMARMHTRITRNDGSVVTGTSGSRPVSDRSDGRRGSLHPAVQAALPPSNARGEGANVPPEGCSEPHALSAHLDDWERRNPGRSCAPGQPGWRDNLRSAMSEINPEGGIASRQGSGNPADGGDWDGMDPRAACPNCSQTIPRLFKLAGMNPPNRVIAPGERADGSGPFRTTPPAGGFNRRENARASPIEGMAQQPHTNQPGIYGRSEGADRWRRIR